MIEIKLYEKEVNSGFLITPCRYLLRRDSLSYPYGKKTEQQIIKNHKFQSAAKSVLKKLIALRTKIKGFKKVLNPAESPNKKYSFYLNDEWECIVLYKILFDKVWKIELDYGYNSPEYKRINRIQKALLLQKQITKEIASFIL